MSATLPPWEDSMSDGCSIPALAKPLFPMTPAQAQGCVPHDQKYYFGGTKEQRLKADAELLIWWLDHHMAADQAWAGFEAIRLGGGPEGRHPKYSWAYGGKRFVYDSKETA